MFNIGTPELLMLLTVALIIVGPKRLPEIARQIGRLKSELTKAQDEVRDMVQFDLSDPSDADGAFIRPNTSRHDMVVREGRTGLTDGEAKKSESDADDETEEQD